MKRCRIELDKKQGITIEVKNGGATQRITLDGEQIVMLVEQAGVSSKITQTSDAVKVECNNFSVDAKMSASINVGATSLELTPAAAALTSATITTTGALVQDGVATMNGAVAVNGAAVINGGAIINGGLDINGGGIIDGFPIV